MIVLTKLTTGEEIVSDTEIREVKGVHVCMLIKPCLLLTVPTEKGMGVQLVPWLMYAKNHIVPYPLDMIATQVELESEIYNKYNSLFGSGIQIPDQKIALQ